MGSSRDDPDAVEPGFLVQLAQKAFLQRLPWVEAAGRNLRSRVGLVAVVEHEQLGTAVPLPRDVCEHALPHYFSARSFAL